MAKTKGAQRRNAYVTVVAGVAVFMSLALNHVGVGFTGFVLYTVIGAVTANATRTLADIGFTKRADNEQ